LFNFDFLKVFYYDFKKMFSKNQKRKKARSKKQQEKEKTLRFISLGRPISQYPSRGADRITALSGVKQHPGRLYPANCGTQSVLPVRSPEWAMPLS
jgi:hypothetical protein